MVTISGLMAPTRMKLNVFTFFIRRLLILNLVCWYLAMRLQAVSDMGLTMRRKTDANYTFTHGILDNHQQMRPCIPTPLTSASLGHSSCPRHAFARLGRVPSTADLAA